MPKQLWIPGGRGGGGHYETFYTPVEVHKMIRDVESKTQTAVLNEFVKDGYGISRPSQNPPVLPPLDPVEAPNWTMPLRIGLGLAAIVVVVILAVVL